MSKKKIIFDCDPGHDDALAILMALASPNIEVLAITTSAGNSLPVKTYNNARKLLALANREDIPLAMGAQKPLMRDLIIADDVHGESGLDGADLPKPTVDSLKKSANDLMYEILSQEKNVSIVVTGPLTNIAILLLSKPEIKEKIDLISFMGGACFGGNYSPQAEFNIFVDPEAAKIVLQSGIPIYMFGLDVTMKAQLYNKDIEYISSINNNVSRIISDLMRFFIKTTTYPFWADENHEEGAHLHDPCAIAYLIDPTLFEVYEMYVDVDTNDGVSCGSTVVDYDNIYNKNPNANVAFNLDLERFKELIYKCLNFYSDI